jgi:hypothetical protein
MDVQPRSDRTANELERLRGKTAKGIVLERLADRNRLPAGRALIVGAVGAAILVAAVGAGNAAAAPRAQKVVLYSVAEQEQYIDNSDSLTLGEGDNPFGNFKDVSGVTQKNSHGPFPGDMAVFSFNLYKDANLKTRVGAASFTCQYNFSKNAFCDAAFQLKNGGTLIAEGAFNFDAGKFTLAVTGGYGSYANTTGVMQEQPSANHSQRLTFQLDNP